MPYFQKNMHFFLLAFLIFDFFKEKLLGILRFSAIIIPIFIITLGTINYTIRPLIEMPRPRSLVQYDTWMFRYAGLDDSWLYRTLAPGWAEKDLYADSEEILQRIHYNDLYQCDKIRGIYLTGYSAVRDKIPHYIRYIKRIGMNSVVFDIKDITGYITFPSEVSLVKTYQKYHVPIQNLDKLVHRLQKEKIYAIARVSQFQDLYMAEKKRDWALHNKNGSSYLVKGKPAWLDPANPEIQKYNLRIIHEVLQSKVDEIQLDYIRYPTDGNWRGVRYKKIKQYSQKPVVLTKYLQRVHSLVRAYSTPLSIDVFGVVAWQEKLDILSTGQDLKIMSQATDIISPMLYPSHFGDVFSGIQNPADSPEFFLYNGTKKVKQIVPKHINIRPWIQAFPMKVTNYNSSYIEKQIIGSYKAGAKGYLKWNASNKYINFVEPDLKTTMNTSHFSKTKPSI